MILNIVLKFHCGNKTWPFINCVCTAWKRTSALVLTLLTSVTTTKSGFYIYQPNNCQMMVLWLSMIEFYIHLSMNHNAIVLFTLQMMIPVILKETATMRVSSQSILQFGHKFMVLHTWRIVEPASWLVMTILMSTTMKLIYGDCFLVGRSID